MPDKKGNATTFRCPQCRLVYPTTTRQAPHSSWCVTCETRYEREQKCEEAVKFWVGLHRLMKKNEQP